MTEPAQGGATSERPDFRPDTSVARYFDYSPVTPLHLAVRFLVVVAVLVAADLAIPRLLHQDAFRHDYRLPQQSSMSALPGYLHYLDTRWQGGGGAPLRIAFLGASPTWGYRIKNPRDTYPYAFRDAARSAGMAVDAANLGSNGQLIGDEYLLAKRLGGRADVLFVQLTYHTFNPAFGNGRPVRFTEIARLPGVSLSRSDAAVLDVKAPVSRSLAESLRAAIASRWALYRERDAVSQKLWGDAPERRLFSAWSRVVARLRPPSKKEHLVDENLFAGAEFSAFDQLEPEQQMIVVARYSDSASFTVDPTEPEVRTLAALARLLRREGRRAVFYMAPMNRDVIDSYGLIDRRQYLANSARIGAAVRSSGFPYLDYNAAKTPVFPAEYFADIDHTTDVGGRAVGRKLFADTASYVKAAGGGSP